jgi:queuine tRNA-ribosyltransferase
MLEAVEAGIDMFDCVLPTRIARNGTVFTNGGLLALKKDRNKHIFGPIDESCPCTACTEYTVAYLRHLFKCNEILGPMLATEHNLYFINRFMHNIRLSIEAGQFGGFKNRFLEEYRAGKNEQSND